MLRIKELRIKRNISQAKLAEVLGVSRSTVAMWETSGTDPDSEMLIKIADYYKVSADYLLGRTDNPDPNTIVLKPVRLKEIRERFHYSSRALAKHLGITEEKYFEYENLEVLPDIDMFYAMANLFSTSISYLAGLTDDPGKVSTNPEIFKRQQEVKAFIEELRNDPELNTFFFTTTENTTVEDLQKVIKMYKAMKEHEKGFENK